MTTTVSWQLHGDVNGTSFEVQGTGIADTTSGATCLDLDVTPSLPAGFDIRMSQRICNFALAAYAADGALPVRFRDAVDRTVHIRPSRVIRIFDAAGEEVAELRALTTMTVHDDTIAVVNWMTGYSHLPAAVAHIEGGEHLVPTDAGAALGVSNFRVRLDNGAELEGLTTVPYRFDRSVLVTPAIRTISEESCTWSSDTHVRLAATSRWQPMMVPADATRG